MTPRHSRRQRGHVSGGRSAGSGADTIVLEPNSIIVLTVPDREGERLPVITSEILSCGVD